jgi:hypothetical protein
LGGVLAAASPTLRTEIEWRRVGHEARARGRPRARTHGMLPSLFCNARIAADEPRLSPRLCRTAPSGLPTLAGAGGDSTAPGAVSGDGTEAGAGAGLGAASSAVGGARDGTSATAAGGRAGESGAERGAGRGGGDGACDDDGLSVSGTATSEPGPGAGPRPHPAAMARTEPRLMRCASESPCCCTTPPASAAGGFFSNKARRSRTDAMQSCGPFAPARPARAARAPVQHQGDGVAEGGGVGGAVC